MAEKQLSFENVEECDCRQRIPSKKYLAIRTSQTRGATEHHSPVTAEDIQLPSICLVKAIRMSLVGFTEFLLLYDEQKSALWRTYCMQEYP